MTTVMKLLFTVRVLQLVFYFKSTAACLSPDWLEFNQSCYFFSTKYSLSFYDALNNCESMDSLLVSIGSDDETNFIIANGPHLLSNYWIGLYRVKCFLNQAVYNKRCSPGYCMLECMQNWMCAGFNLRPVAPGSSGGCLCELKDAKSWLSFPAIKEVGSGFWGYPIHLD
ncbi:hypothetical protein HELRODRAFT_179298 [Helobdella robusta]|uniref:C-type lectin domain-containing protein n=1 Tax=Helobdella robusta TaxID=6412 RepID=T1FEI1_HELRO|nr:hypothetical protein HELRODRAFT_179298 [Helobdella robusta]ESN95523.1 hypothetical protein HELRODRAFT_179298 [Helobdella robusta]